MSENHDHKKENPSTFGSRLKKGFLIFNGIIFFLLVVVLIAVISVNVYLNSNRSKLLDDLPFADRGTVSFRRVSLTLFKDFPDATISLSEVLVHDSLFHQHETPILKAKKFSAAVSLKNVFEKNVKFKSASFSDGAFNLFTDKTQYNNLNSFLKKNTGGKKEKDFEIEAEQIQLKFNNFDFNIVDEIKRSVFAGHINTLKTNLDLANGDVSAQADLDVNMQEVTFKKENGSFLEDSQLRGSILLSIVDEKLTLEKTPLYINENIFWVSVDFDFSKKKVSQILIENNRTAFAKCIPLLPQNLQKELSKYSIEKPFYSKTKIRGYFKPNQAPNIDIDFNIADNKVSVQGHPFHRVNFNGQFQNRVYEDDGEQKRKINGLNITAKNLSAWHQNFQLKTKEALIKVKPNAAPTLQADLNINGQPKDIHQWLENENFFFENGEFKLLANINGPLNDYNQLVIESDARLELNNFITIYKPSETAFPFEQLILDKKPGDAFFSLISSTLEEDHKFEIDGDLKNLPALLFEMVGRASSNVNFSANKLSWSDFLTLFGESGYLKNKKPRDDKAIKKSIKETARGIHFNFQPRLTVNVDTLQYLDILELHNFHTGIHFEDENTVILEKTNFNYENGEVNFWARLDISNPYVTPFEFELHTNKLNLKKLLPPFNFFNVKLLKEIENLPENTSIDIVHKGIMDDTKGLVSHTSTGEIIFKVNEGRTILGKINYVGSPALETTKTILYLEGEPIVINEFLKTDQFFFDKGRFKVLFNYEGNIPSFSQLLNECGAIFKLRNSEVYYKVADVTFPLTDFELDLNKDEAAFDLLMYSDQLNQSMKIEGMLDNLSELVLGNTGKKLKTEAQIYSPKVRWQQFVDVFAPEGVEPKKETSIDALKLAVTGMFNTFDPHISVRLDTFLYRKDLLLENVKMGVELLDSSIIAINETGFNFNKGSMNVNGVFDLGIKDQAPFSANFKTKKLDVLELIESVGYLNLPSFKSIKKLSGFVTMNLDLKGVIADDAKGLIMDKNEGQIEFSLENIKLEGFEPLDALAKKVKMQRRFRELKFAPITNTITIDGENMHIPQMEIQSNAVNFFVEGTLSYGNSTNIWVSVPLQNLRKADRTIIPSKQGYPATRHKVHVEVTSDENGANQFKFRTRKKKFYKQRDMLDQFKIDKKRDREWRKARKKNKD